MSALVAALPGRSRGAPRVGPVGLSVGPALGAVGAILLGVLTLWIYQPIGRPWVFEDAAWLDPIATEDFWGATRWPGVILILQRVAGIFWRVAMHATVRPEDGVHVGLVLLHLVNVWLIWRLLRRWSEAGAWMSAAILCLHPLFTESVAYASGGREVVSAAWLLLAITVGASRSMGLGRGLLVLGLTALAVIAKPSAVMAIVLVPYALWWLAPRERVMALVMGVLAVAALVAVPQWHEVQRLAGAGVVDVGGPGAWTYAGVTTAALGVHLGHVVWPLGLSVDRDWIGWSIAYPWGPTVALVALLIIVWTGVQARRRAPWLLWAAGWTLLQLAPRFAVQQLEILNEHQMYVPLLAVLPALVLTVVSWKERA